MKSTTRSKTSLISKSEPFEVTLDGIGIVSTHATLYTATRAMLEIGDGANVWNATGSKPRAVAFTYSGLVHIAATAHAAERADLVDSFSNVATSN